MECMLDMPAKAARGSESLTMAKKKAEATG